MNEWLFTFDAMRAVGAMAQIASVGLSLYDLWLVQTYTRRKDQADFLRARWAEQAQLNLASLNNVEARHEYERIVYGDTYKPNKETSLRFFLLFMTINMVQHHYIARQHKVLSKKAYEAYSCATLSLVKRQESLVLYLLRSRGYPTAFAEEIERLLRKVQPPALPQAADLEQVAPPQQPHRHQFLSG